MYFGTFVLYMWGLSLLIEAIDLMAHTVDRYFLQEEMKQKHMFNIKAKCCSLPVLQFSLSFREEMQQQHMFSIKAKCYSLPVL